MKTVVFLGYSNSGKTFAIVSVVRELARAGSKVGTLKHIHEEGFTIDTQGKDTWRHAHAGASMVVALAPDEMAIIQKKDTRRMTIDELTRIFAEDGVDYLLVEGLYRKLSRRRGVVRVLCARSKEEVRDLLKVHPRPACILGSGGLREKRVQGITVLKLPKDIGKLMELIR